MTGFTDYIFGNVWIWVPVVILAVIVGDEIMGFSRSLFGDDSEDTPITPQKRLEAEQEGRADPPEQADAGEEEPEGHSVEDMLRRKR